MRSQPDSVGGPSDPSAQTLERMPSGDSKVGDLAAMLDERLRLEILLSDLSTTLISVSVDRIDAELESGLRSIVEFLGVDRATLMLFSEDKSRLRVVHSYAVDGVRPMPPVMLDERFEWYVERIRRGQMLRSTRLPEELPEHATREREYCLEENLKSNVTIPLDVGGEILGAVAFGSFREHREWPDEMLSRFRLNGDIVANALDRKLGEQALRDSEERYRLVAETASDGIITIDEDGLITYANPATEGIFGYAPEELIGQRLVRIIPGSLRERHQLALENFIESGKKSSSWRGLQVLGLHADGSERTIELSFGAMRDKDGRYSFTSIVRDLTQRIRAEEEASRLRESLAHVTRLASMGAMAGGIAHEINQPLTAIATYAQACSRMLRSGDLDKSATIETIEQISQEALRAGGIIHSVREMLQTRPSDRATLCVNQLIREATRLAWLDPRLQDVELDFALAESLPPVMVHDVQIQQVILNLILNGVEAMEDLDHARSVITITTASESATCIRVSVSDMGKGLAEEIKADLFNPFFTTKEGGLGMGLSISHTIITAHGGRLWFTDNPDIGTSFHFLLPVATGDASSGCA